MVKAEGATGVVCGICDAPLRRPIPAGYTITTYAVHRRNFFQVHKPDCPAGFRQTIFLPDDEDEPSE